MTHGIGAVAAVVGLAYATVVAARHGDGLRMAAAVVFGTTLLLLYTFSTLYHSFPWPRVKHVFKVLDHAAIYLLIAGTYTPFTLVTLRGHEGWWLFAVVWALAVAGVTFEAFWVYRPKWVSVVIYLGMGWLSLAAVGQLVQALPAAAIRLLVAGGLFYTLGAAFYVPKRLPYSHMVWHIFVLGGSVCHFLSVALYVLSATPAA